MRSGSAASSIRSRPAAVAASPLRSSTTVPPRSDALSSTTPRLGCRQTGSSSRCSPRRSGERARSCAHAASALADWSSSERASARGSATRGGAARRSPRRKTRTRAREADRRADASTGALRPLRVTRGAAARPALLALATRSRAHDRALSASRRARSSTVAAARARRCAPSLLLAIQLRFWRQGGATRSLVAPRLAGVDATISAPARVAAGAPVVVDLCPARARLADMTRTFVSRIASPPTDVVLSQPLPRRASRELDDARAAP